MIARGALFALLAAAPIGAQPPSPDSLLREQLWEDLRELPPGERPRVGLVLSAGAVRGLAHVGVLSVLQDAGFPIDVVAGTSMGAVVGSLFAGGAGIDEIWGIGLQTRLDSGSNFSRTRLLGLILNESLLSSERTEKMIEDVLGGKRFDQLEKPFACVAMDIRTGEKIVFRDGPLAPAVRASMNLPGLFTPVHYRHRLLVDGGVVDYIPVDAAKRLGAEWTIASVTEGDFSASAPQTVLDTLIQVTDIRGAILSRQQRNEADFLIEPDVGAIVYYDVSRPAEVMERGMIAASARLDAAKESLLLKSFPGLWARWRKEMP